MKIALLFPGYGSQFVGMGKELYDEYRIVQEYFEEASHCLNVNFVKLCFASSDVELSKLANAYTSLFLVGTATYAVLKEHGIHPDIVAGYNNGESAALFAAGCFSLPDGLYLLNKFASFYQEYIDTQELDAVRVTGVETAQLEDMCKSASDAENKVFIAMYNSGTDHVVAGNQLAVMELRSLIGDSGNVDDLGAEAGLHSVLMNNVVTSFKDYLEKVDFKDLKIPLISCVDGAEITVGADTKERFISFITSALDVRQVIKKLAVYDCIVVANPGDNLAKIVRHYYPEKIILPIAKKSDIDTLREMNSAEQILQ